MVEAIIVGLVYFGAIGLIVASYIVERGESSTDPKYKQYNKQGKKGTP